VYVSSISLFDEALVAIRNNKVVHSGNMNMTGNIWCEFIFQWMKFQCQVNVVGSSYIFLDF